MADMKKIDTKQYVTEGKVQIDGMIWSVILPGAGKELEISKAQRRIKLYENKVESGNFNEEDLDKLDALEDYFYNFFKGIFKDDTQDNAQVNKWVDETPLGIILKAFEDIKSQAAEVV